MHSFFNSIISFYSTVSTESTILIFPIALSGNAVAVRHAATDTAETTAPAMVLIIASSTPKTIAKPATRPATAARNFLLPSFSFHVLIAISFLPVRAYFHNMTDMKKGDCSGSRPVLCHLVKYGNGDALRLLPADIPA